MAENTLTPISVLPRTIKTTHPTRGLPGYPAYDWFREAGTVVGAPASGKISRVSGDDPANAKTPGIYGRSVYLETDEGGRAFLTHFDKLDVTENQRVERGTPLGTVADYGSADHIHYGIESSRPLGSVVTLGSGGDTEGPLGRDRLAGDTIGGSSLLDGLRSGAGGVGSWLAGDSIVDAAKGIPDVPGNVLDRALDIPVFGDAVSFFKWVGTPRNWQRILEILGGTALALLGVVMLGKASGAAAPVGQVAAAARAVR